LAFSAIRLERPEGSKIPDILRETKPALAVAALGFGNREEL